MLTGRSSGSTPRLARRSWPTRGAGLALAIWSDRPGAAQLWSTAATMLDSWVTVPRMPAVDDGLLASRFLGAVRRTGWPDRAS